MPFSVVVGASVAMHISSEITGSVARIDRLGLPLSLALLLFWFGLLFLFFHVLF